MAKIDDIELFTQVVKAGGLGAAGRQIGLSPAAMTARINALEARYNTRLLNRSTRSISLTPAGQRFYDSCINILSELHSAEAALQDQTTELSGNLGVTATSDFGRQFVAPALAAFAELHPKVKITLHLNDHVVNLMEYGLDLAIRIGNLPDSNMIARRLSNNRRVLCASPSYLNNNGIPTTPEELNEHRCLVMQRIGQPLNEWRFYKDNKQSLIKVPIAMQSNDGAQIRQWALQGLGITLKSYWDVKADLDSGNLLPLLDDYIQDFDSRHKDSVGLQMIYPSRQYLPKQVQLFMDFLHDWMQQRNP